MSITRGTSAGWIQDLDSVTLARNLGHGWVQQTAASGGGSNLTGNNGTQTNTGGTGEISTVYPLTGNNGAQTNEGGTGAISVSFDLAGNNGVQVNEGGTGAVSIPGAIELTGNNGTQVNEGSTGAIATTYTLTGSNGVQVNTGGTGAITEGEPEPELIAFSGGGPGFKFTDAPIKKRERFSDDVKEAVAKIIAEAKQEFPKEEARPVVKQIRQEFKPVQDIEQLNQAIARTQRLIQEHLEELEDEEALIYLL